MLPTVSLVTSRFGVGPISVMAYGAVGDGVTDDTVALNAAFAAIALVGGQLFFPQGVFYAPNGIDFHSTVGESGNTYVLSGMGAKESIILTHNAAISLDLGGRNRVVIRDMGIRDDGTTAQVGIARYRNTVLDPPDGHGHQHSYENVYMEGMWSKAAIYSIGSEVNQHINCHIYQNGNGAGYYSAPTDLLSVDSLTPGTISGGSNTVNNFYSGSIVAAPSTTGGAVYFGLGIADQVNFYGTYLVGWSGGYNVKVGALTTDTMQGLKVFQGVRFEGTTDAINITGSQVQEIVCRECTFGQNPGLDINYTNIATSTGFENCVIENNQHYDRGMTIPVIEKSRIVVRDTSVYHATTLTVTGTGSHIASSYIECSGLSLGGSTVVYSSELAFVDGFNHLMRRRFGPNSKTSSGNSQGSVIVNRPFGTAPTGAEEGTLATAGASNWEPTLSGTTEDYPVFYDGSRWHALCPVYATPTTTGTQGTVAYDSSLLYIAAAASTWLTIPTVEGTVSYEDDTCMYDDAIVTY
jgi:hypothetical protein